MAGGIEQPVPTDWGAWAGLLARRIEMAFTRHPRHVVAQALPRQLCGRSVGDGRGGRNSTRLGGEDYKGNRACGRCTRATERSFTCRTSSTTKGDQVRQAGSDEEREQHLEDLR